MTPSLCVQLLQSMMRIRMVEEAIAARYGEQEMRCPVHLSIGQEGVAAGVCAALATADYVLSTHRAHAHYLAKGGDLNSMMAEIYGKATGCCTGKGGSMHLVDLNVSMLGSTPIVGGSVPVAVGTAFGSWLEGKPHVTTVFFGEGATEEGVFAESINFAALKKLPMLFVCENNLYSVYSPMEVRQPEARSRVAIAQAHGMATFTGDGNDVESVYALTQQAVTLARRGEGPVFLEFSTYRWREHCGPNYDNDIGYRTEAEFHAWHTQCPVERLRKKLLQAGSVSPADLQVMESACTQEIADAFRFAKESPFPDQAAMFRGLYADEVKQ